MDGFRKEAIKRGRQTENTPFMTQPLVGMFGFKATNEHAESVLDGTFSPPEGIDPYAAKLLPHLVRPQKITQGGRITTEIKTKECLIPRDRK